MIFTPLGSSFLRKRCTYTSMALVLTSSPHSHKWSTSWFLLTMRPVRISRISSRLTSRASVADQAGAATRAAPREGTHPRLEFRQGEWLGHVVVGTQVQSFDALLDAVGGSQDQHRQVRIARAQPPQHFQAGQLGQAEVEDEEVEGLGDEGQVGRHAVAYCIDGVAVVPQRAGEAVGQDVVVFRDEDAHGPGSSVLPRRAAVWAEAGRTARLRLFRLVVSIENSGTAAYACPQG